MARLSIQCSVLALCGVLTGSLCSAQTAAPAGSQNPNATPAASPAQSKDSGSAGPADAKKSKKVWTNEDVGGLNGPVSVVGNSKEAGKPSTTSKADAQYIANLRKQLEKLHSQLDDTDKQLADLKDFSAGKAPSTSGGYQLNKGYNRVPVDQQITSLTDKKKELEGKIDALLDEARKKGVQPGDLR